MADIAFLLLIFFLVTTTIQSDKGLNMVLPQYMDEPVSKAFKDRNIFKININSENSILVEDEVFTGFEHLRSRIKTFVMNNGARPDLSENPEKAIVSLKYNRGTHYNTFIETLDAIQGAYYEIYGQRVGITAEDFRRLDMADPEEKRIYKTARAGIPMNISISEPTNTQIQ